MSSTVVLDSNYKAPILAKKKKHPLWDEYFYMSIEYVNRYSSMDKEDLARLHTRISELRSIVVNEDSLSNQ